MAVKDKQQIKKWAEGRTAADISASAFFFGGEPLKKAYIDSLVAAALAKEKAEESTKTQVHRDGPSTRRSGKQVSLHQ